MNILDQQQPGSIDNSSFENATHIHDMNDILPDNINGNYDTVIDGGCLEHIFNFPQAVKNCSLLLKPGGQVIHILPANNFCGHGFYQFSPELFFSLYSSKNGYIETEVFLADLSNSNYWFKVRHPKDGKRVNVKNTNNLYILVRSVLAEVTFDHSNVQQSDYLYEWKNSDKNENDKVSKKFNFKEKLKKYPLIFETLRVFYYLFLKLRASFSQSDQLSVRNTGLTRVKIKDLLG